MIERLKITMLAALIFGVADCSRAADIDTLRFIQEYRVQVEVPHPHFIVKGGNNQYLVGGRDGPLVFIGSDGRASRQVRLPVDANRTIQLFDAAALPDGSFLLCGHLFPSNSVDSTSEGYRDIDHSLLVRIGPSGEEVSRNLLSTNTKDENIIQVLRKIAPWEGDFAIVGQTNVSPVNAPSKMKVVITVVKVNGAGVVEWSRNYPSGTNYIDDVEWPVALADGSIVVAFHRSQQTILFRLASDGRVLAEATFEKPFVLVSSTKAENTVELLENDAVDVTPASSGTAEVLRLSEDLRPEKKSSVARVQISAKRVFRMGVDGLAVFGYQIAKSGVPEPIAAYLEVGKQQIKTLSPPLGEGTAFPMVDAVPIGPFSFAALRSESHFALVLNKGAIEYKRGNAELIVSVFSILK